LSVVLLPASRGYWGIPYATLGSAVLTGPAHDGDTTWMSIVPMEVESQEIGIAAARGHTVVQGFGMGWAAASIGAAFLGAGEGALSPRLSRGRRGADRLLRHRRRTPGGANRPAARAVAQPGLAARIAAGARWWTPN